MIRLLPWDYGVRNLGRRPLRTVLTILALFLVVVLLVGVIAFVRGLRTALQRSGEARVALIHSLAAADNLENSSISDSVPSLVKAGLSQVLAHAADAACLSPELLTSTIVEPGESGAIPALAVFRGVRPEVFLVRRSVSLVAGTFPRTGEILVGRLAAVKLGIPASALRTGGSLRIEGRDWRISGEFIAPGTLLESEIWCPLDDLKLHARRPNDLSLVALRLEPSGDLAAQRDELDDFCRFRYRELEIAASLETEYYASLERHHQPLRALAWAMVVLIGLAGSCGAVNTSYAAATSRVREFAALQAMGFARLAIGLSLVQEAALQAALATLLAAGCAALLLSGAAVRFSMSAFTLQVDGVTLLASCLLGMALGIMGTLPALWRAFRIPVVEGLRAL